jgi:hypothetical protein
LLVVMAVFAATVIGSMIPELTAPGTQSTAARIAEWARGHGMSPVVTWLEQMTYKPPKVGGRPAANSPLLNAPTATPSAPVSLMPAPIAPVASPALPREGQWQVIATAQGKPAMAQTFLRPDAVHTSYTAAAVWFNPHLVSAQLHPGTQEPGGTGWPVPPTIPAGSRTGLLAAFNSGFRLADSHGGFYMGGRYAQPLATGGASMVFYKDGTMTVGQWGSDVTMTPQVAAVRQNLSLIVDNGQVVPNIDSNVQKTWGVTIGNQKYVWRSGIGVTANGSIVNVIGPRLSAQTLAILLQRAGAVRAMELDINPQWTSYIRYEVQGDPSNPNPVNLLSNMAQPANRYNTTSIRDFVTLYAR